MSKTNEYRVGEKRPREGPPPLHNGKRHHDQRHVDGWAALPPGVQALVAEYAGLKLFLPVVYSGGGGGEGPLSIGVLCDRMLYRRDASLGFLVRGWMEYVFNDICTHAPYNEWCIEGEYSLETLFGGLALQLVEATLVDDGPQQELLLNVLRYKRGAAHPTWEQVWRVLGAAEDHTLSSYDAESTFANIEIGLGLTSACYFAVVVAFETDVPMGMKVSTSCAVPQKLLASVCLHACMCAWGEILAAICVWGEILAAIRDVEAPFQPSAELSRFTWESVERASFPAAVVNPTLCMLRALDFEAIYTDRGFRAAASAIETLHRNLDILSLATCGSGDDGLACIEKCVVEIGEMMTAVRIALSDSIRLPRLAFRIAPLGKLL